MNPNLREHSPDQSDSDDWTLVSFNAPNAAPVSATCTPKDETALESSQESIGDDNLIEVELEISSDSVNSSFERLNDELTPDEQHRTSNDLIVPGFQALDTTDDGEASQPESRHTSVDRLDRVHSESSQNLSQLDESSLNTTSLLACRTERRPRRNEEFDDDAEESETETEERGLLYDSGARHSGSFRARIRHREQVRLMTKSLIHLVTLTLVALIFIFVLQFILELQEANNEVTLKPTTKNLEMEFSRFSGNSDINIAPELYKELQSVDDELSQCVKRQNPSWYKYYMSEERFKETESKPQRSMKHYNGLVCYGQETQWRERFSKLREEKKLDLSKIMQEAKSAVANDLLGFYHPSLQFKLILNQLEYLEFLENKRNKKQSDETIKYLKVENMQLYRQLNKPLKSEGAHKPTKGLEWENLQLRRELNALKARMNIKAGPSYIRQSQELEQYERENVLLKHFLYDISKEVSVISKQFNLQTIDAPINLNDLEILKFHTKITKEYLARLGMKVSNLLVENTGLKEELSDHHRVATVNKSISPAFQANEEEDSFIVKNNHSEALMKDSCIQNLLKLREQAAFLQDENKYLRNCCSRTSDQSLVSYQDSSLNLTRKTNEHQPTGLHRQIAALATGLERGIRNAVALAGSRSFDELSLFLEEFTNRIKSTSLVPKELLSSQQNGDLSDTQSKVIESSQDPKTMLNYMREELKIQSTPEIQPSNHQIIMNRDEFIKNPDLGIPAIRDSWFFKRAMQRKLLRKVKYVDSRESSAARLEDKLRRESLSSNHRRRERHHEHTFVDSKIRQRKSKKSTMEKARKMKSQKYSRSEL